MSLHVFPWKNRLSGEVVTVDSFRAPADSVHLYEHFVENRRIVKIDAPEDEIPTLTGRDVCRMIRESDASWRNYVPEQAWKMAERHAKLEEAPPA